MDLLAAILTIIAAYLIGAIPFGFLVARMRGIDIFAQGSGNIGATNVGRVLGRKFGFIVFALDCAKGAGAVGMAQALQSHFDGELWSHRWVAVGAGLAAFLGHCFPVYLRFRGGKGVATGAGVVAVLLPIPMLAAFAIWGILLCAFRYMSLASIISVLVLCAAHLRTPAAWDLSNPRSWFCVVAGLLVVLRHRGNIKRLIAGTENQLKDHLLMQQFNKSLHLLALGLWFGMSVFFTFVAAPSLFSTLEKLGESKKRESWFPRPMIYNDIKDLAVNAPKEQGTRAAGYAVGPIFLWYFAIQGACGFIALATAMSWMKAGDGSRLHRWRVNVIIAAVTLVLIGWPLQRHVSELRLPRNANMERYLASPADEERETEMRAARAEFGMWHGFSLLANFGAIACVAVAMAMAGNVPANKPNPV